MRAQESKPFEDGRTVDEVEALVPAARDGDRRAAQALLTSLLPRVRNLVRYLVHGDEDTNDIAQEALLAVLRGLGSFRADGPFRAWVDRVVVRATFAFVRKRRHEPAAQPSRLQPGDLDGHAVAALPDEYLSRRRLVALLDQLPMEQRRALVLHHVLEMSVPEIARHFAVPPETVRSRLRLGRTRLRESALGAHRAIGGLRDTDAAGDGDGDGDFAGGRDEA